jgi:hypothetical protein
MDFTAGIAYEALPIVVLRFPETEFAGACWAIFHLVTVSR